MHKLELRSASKCLRSRGFPLRSRPSQFRCLHATSPLEATPRAPSARRASQPIRVARRVTSPSAEPSSIEDSLPPIALLESAQKSGALQLEPEQALTFLRQYQENAASSNRNWEQNLCDEHNITPTTLGLLAGILRRCQTNPQRHLALKLMTTASPLGSKSATFELITSALRTGTLSNHPAPLQHLGLLAKKDNDPQALTLLGRVHEARGKPKEALACFQKATTPPTGSIDFDGAGDALVSEGRILRDLGDTEGAKSAFEKAALELDEPHAYFYLSKYQEPNSLQQQVYLLKAATSGVLDACHNLGALEMEKWMVEARGVELRRLKGFGMAYEWFRVAAEGGFGLSMLNLALMCRFVGEVEEGRIWLEKAERIGEVRDQAREVGKQFSEKSLVADGLVSVTAGAGGGGKA